MYAKLALRNVRRQFGSYMIYFFTIMITIAMMFSVLNMVYVSDLIKQPSSKTSVQQDQISTGVNLALVILSAVISLIISRSQLFILGVRKKELGTYKLLGMKNHDIIKMFLSETGIIYILTFFCGMLLGLAFYQGLNLVVAGFLNMDFDLSGYSFKASAITGLLTLFIFLVSAVSSAEYIKKNDINVLVSNRRTKVKLLNIESVALSRGICIFSVAVSIIVIVLNIFALDFISKSDFIVIILPLSLFIVIPVSIVLFNMSYPRCVVDSLLKNKKFKSRKTNTFLLRQLSSKSVSNASMYGAVSLLTTIGAIMMCVLFCVKPLTDIVSYGYNKYGDLIVYSDHFDQTKSVIDKYVKNYNIKEVEELYFSYNEECYCAVPFSFFKGYMNLKGESFEMGETSYMRIVLTDDIEKEDLDTDSCSGENFKYKDIDLKYEGLIADDFLDCYVFPDEVFRNLVNETESDGSVICYSKKYSFIFKGKYDYVSMGNEFIENKIEYYAFDSFEIYQMLAQFAPAMLILIFCVVFCLMIPMAMIALKVFSEVNTDREKYQKLSNLGVSKTELRRTLIKQTASVFIFPLVTPLFFVLSFVPASVRLITKDIKISVSVALYSVFTLAIIFISYFIITFRFLNKKELKEKEQRKIW